MASFLNVLAIHFIFRTYIKVVCYMYFYSLPPLLSILAMPMGRSNAEYVAAKLVCFNSNANSLMPSDW